MRGYTMYHGAHSSSASPCSLSQEKVAGDAKLDSVVCNVYAFNTFQYVVPSILFQYVVACRACKLTESDNVLEKRRRVYR